MEKDNEVKKVGDGVSNFFLVQVQCYWEFLTSHQSCKYSLALNYAYMLIGLVIFTCSYRLLRLPVIV